MRVLIIPSWYFRAGSNAIPGRMFLHHARALRAKGIDAQIFFAELNFRSSIQRNTSFSIADDVPTWRVSQWFLPKINYKITKAWAARYAGIILEALDGKLPDLIHAQSYLAGIVACEIKKKTGIPFIITERLSAFVTGNIRDHYKPLIRECFHSANLITCVSPGLKGHLEKFTDAPVRVIPNFFDPGIFHRDPAVKKYDRFTWVSIGEPAQIKGLDSLLLAYCQMRIKFPSQPMQLIMIDEIREKKELLRIAQNYGYAGEIIWKGLIPQAEVADVLRKSHVVVSASRVETFGKAILEAQACGLPVIATRTDGAQYLIQSKDQGILVGIDDIDALIGGMKSLYGSYENFHPELISEAVRGFSKDEVIKLWLSAYNEVLK